MIITRRFWCANENVTKALTIDVRTTDKVSATQAAANAESLAERKFGGQAVFTIMPMKITRMEPDYSVGPRR